MNPLPELTHLQFLILDCVGAAEVNGRDLRAMLKERGISKTGPAFYQLMSRMEEAKFLEGDYTQKIVDGQIIRERVYKMLRHGSRAYEATARFYNRQSGKGSLIPGISFT